MSEPAEKIGRTAARHSSTHIEYEQAEIRFEPGDTLTLYTDGINEALISTADNHTIDRLRDHVKAHRSTIAELGQLDRR